VNGNTARPFGFLVVRAYTDGQLVPEHILSPLEIVHVVSREHNMRTPTVRLRDGRELALFSPTTTLELAELIDTAMRELERVAMRPGGK
jgi:hypothetical protein